MRADRSTRDACVPLPGDALSARTDDEAIVTNLDGSPLEPERVWPGSPSFLGAAVALALLLDSGVRAVDVVGVLGTPGQVPLTAWAGFGLSWVRGLALLLLPAAVVARRPGATRARPLLLVAALVLATSELSWVAGGLPSVVFTLAGLARSTSGWPPLAVDLLVYGHVLGDAALTCGLALFALALRTHHEPHGRRNPIGLALLLGLPVAGLSLRACLGNSRAAGYFLPDEIGPAARGHL